MKRIILALTLVSLVFLCGNALACISFPALKFDDQSIVFDNYKDAAAVKSRLEEIKKGLEIETQVHDAEWCIKEGYALESCPMTEKTVAKYAFTDDEIDTIAGFITNGYSVELQNDSEYLAFLQNAESTNADENNCSLFKAVSRQGQWTGYILDRKNIESCPATRCSPVAFSVIWNDLGGGAANPETPGSEENNVPATPESEGSTGTAFDTTTLFYAAGIIIGIALIAFAALRMSKAKKK